MLLSNYYFHADDNNHEALPLASEGFPYACTRNEMDRYAENSISWHWHAAVEITYVEEGTVRVLTPEQEMILNKGDAVFINSGVLHFFQAVDNCRCVLYAQVFDIHLLTGMYNSVFEEKYCSPVIRNSNLQAWKIHPESMTTVRMMESVLNGIELTTQEKEGYEFEIRTELGRFWLGLLKETEQIRERNPIRNSADVERLKKMMDYVSAHYAEKVRLEEIAAAAGISTRECTRCFRRCINSTPTDYLTQTRLRMAAEQLGQTDQSILEISENCGFSSAGYFSKVFRDAYGCTPNAYRHRG
jgi:AraC-like DNA-binding protein